MTWRIPLHFYVSFAKETYKRDDILPKTNTFKEPTTRSHPIVGYRVCDVAHSNSLVCVETAHNVERFTKITAEYSAFKQSHYAHANLALVQVCGGYD